MTLNYEKLIIKNIILFIIFNVFYEIPRAAAAELDAVSDWALSPGPALLARQEPVVFSDGRGLPAGHGTVANGRALFNQHCVRCHGSEGRGGYGGELAGGAMDLTRPSPDQTIGSYWPYAPTLFDFIRRAMPMDAPRTLDDDQVYALCAYLLFLNGILPEGAVIDAHTLTAIRMPNRDGFIGIDAPLPHAGGGQQVESRSRE